MPNKNDIHLVKKFHLIMTRAKEKGFEFDLTIQSFRNLLRAKKCYFTGMPISAANNTLSIDRLNNDKGYIQGNVVACHVRFNNKKNSLTVQEIKDLYRGVVLRRRK